MTVHRSRHSDFLLLVTNLVILFLGSFPKFCRSRTVSICVYSLLCVYEQVYIISFSDLRLSEMETFYCTMENAFKIFSLFVDCLSIWIRQNLSILSPYLPLAIQAIHFS